MVDESIVDGNLAQISHVAQEAKAVINGLIVTDIVEVIPSYECNVIKSIVITPFLHCIENNFITALIRHREK